MYKRVIGILFFNCDTVIVILFIGHLLFRGFLFYAASDHFVHLLSDEQGLVDELVGDFLHTAFIHGEDEVVAAVASEGEGAVVLAEEGCVVDAAWLLGDVDVAVVHGLDLAVGDEGFHFREVGAVEVEDVQVVVDGAESHHAVEGGGSFDVHFFYGLFHF